MKKFSKQQYSPDVKTKVPYFGYVHMAARVLHGLMQRPDMACLNDVCITASDFYGLILSSLQRHGSPFLSYIP